MPIHYRKTAASLAAMLTLLAVAGNARAVTLTAGSTLDAHTANLDDGDVDNTNPGVDSLPYVTPVTAFSDLETSTLTPDLTSTGFAFTYAQNIVDPDAATGGTGDMFFEAAADTPFTITGVLNSDAPFDELSATLTQDPNGSPTIVYYYDQINSPTLTLDTSGGFSLTGTLLAGDEYEFRAGEYMSTVESDPTLSGAVTISFVSAVPEPAASGLLIFAGAAALRRRARLSRATPPSA